MFFISTDALPTPQRRAITSPASSQQCPASTVSTLGKCRAVMILRLLYQHYAMLLCVVVFMRIAFMITDEVVIDQVCVRTQFHL